MRTMKLIFSLLTAQIFFTTMVAAENVKIVFSNSCSVVDAQGQQVETDFPYKFKSLVLGGRCGTAVAKYNGGMTGNNALTKGMNCIVSGKLVKLSGKGWAKKKLKITNELNTTRATVTTSSSGNFSTSFKVLADGPIAYYLYGPTDAQQHRVQCGVYIYDHTV